MSYNPLWNLPSFPATVAPGNNNDMPWQDAGYVTLTAIGAGWTLTGIVAPVADRPVIVIVNNTTQTLTIANASVASGASNRITTSTGANVTVTANQVVTLFYDMANGTWRIAAIQ